MLYAPIRREIFKQAFTLMGTMPGVFSFHDQIVCLLYLLNGKFVRLPRLLYLYDFGVWEKTETGQKRDVDFYTAAGLDPAINLLHWFLCGFEGAVLTLHADVFSDHPPAQLQAIANHWFVTMFARFKGHPRLTFGSPFTRDVEKVCTKLKAMSGPMSFENMLKEITNVISLFSKGQAQTYFDFWNAVMNKRKPIPSHTDIQNLSVAS